jgi:hypothetical protein
LAAALAAGIKKTAPLARSRSYLDWRELSLCALAVFATIRAFLPGAVLLRAAGAGLFCFCFFFSAVGKGCGGGEENGRGGQQEDLSHFI